MVKVAYTAPALTVDKIEKAVARATQWIDDDDSTIQAGPLAKIDEAITAAGQAASTWHGRKWWWLQSGLAKFWTHTKTIATVANTGATRSSNTTTITTTAAHGLEAGQWVQVSVTTGTGFDGVWQVLAVPTTTTLTYYETGADVSSAAGDGSVYPVTYPLRSITVAGAVSDSGCVMEDLYTVEKVWKNGNWPLQRLANKVELEEYILMYSSNTGSPTQYVMLGEDLLGIIPIPSSALEFTVAYIKRHGKIASATASEAALIVPAEFHWGVYVNGASWLLLHETMDPASLAESPAFVETMDRMAEADSYHYDDETEYGYPADRRVILIDNDVS